MKELSNAVHLLLSNVKTYHKLTPSPKEKELNLMENKKSIYSEAIDYIHQYQLVSSVSSGAMNENNHIYNLSTTGEKILNWLDSE